MKLLTPELLALFKKDPSKEDLEDPIVLAKFTTKDASYTWYITQLIEEEQLFYGYIVGDFKEWGYIPFKELLNEEAHIDIGEPAKQDMDFVPQAFSELGLVPIEEPTT